MENEPQESDPKRDSLMLEDSFTQSTANFNLFQAYREGNLDCEVISTQKAPVCTNENPPPGECVSKEASDEKVANLPRSWCLPQSSSVDASETKMRNVVSLGALCKPQEFHYSVDCVPPPVTITRETYKPTDSLVKMIRSNAILVNQRQRGNPLLKHIHNVAWEYADIEPDYVVGRNNCAYFLRSAMVFILSFWCRTVCCLVNMSMFCSSVAE
ncbi:hypothetical protein PHET_06940 [Paragonimus heterotremus]|uniref:ERCC1-like central domain-containing protein n=1 Tax=Paragonimus heterotremus TaxID=100268 RepID=A0A8J4TIP9_9TREM|nr:hypothetical protein PHET_06940 [Paragonimus heterotremus]